MNKTIQLQSNDGVDNLFPTMKMDLLWTNASPMSNFAPQTISIDLTNYKFVYIIFRRQNNNSSLPCNILIIVDNSGMAISTYSDVLISRGISSSSASGIVFDNATKINTYGTGTTDNLYMIPYQIYGIKGVIE